MEGRRLIERAFTGPAGLLRARPGQSPALRPVELGVGIFALMSLQRIGEDIVRLRDTAAVVMPEELRLAETELRAVEARRAAEAEAARAAAEKKPASQPANRAGARR